MKTGKTIDELILEVNNQLDQKRDFISSTSFLRMGGKGDLHLEMDNPQEDSSVEEIFETNKNCRSQIASRLKIPRPYFERMNHEATELLAENVNHWFYKNPETRMIRTLGGTARAFLSERYRPLDNFDLMRFALPELKSQPEMEVVSCEVTEKRLYIKALFPRIEAEVKRGDIVQSGLVISNSEVGCGSIRIEPLIFRLVCLNGMITNAAMRKYHVGRSQESDSDVFEVLSDKTKEVDDEAFWMKVIDVIRASFSRDIFDRNVDCLRDASSRKIEGTPTKAIEVVTKKLKLTEFEGDNLLKHLIEGGDLSQYGLANAVTRTSQDLEDYDRATKLERAGGKIIELPKRDWKIISEAA